MFNILNLFVNKFVVALLLTQNEESISPDISPWVVSTFKKFLQFNNESSIDVNPPK